MGYPWSRIADAECSASPNENGVHIRHNPLGGNGLGQKVECHHILHRDIQGHGRHYTVSVADRNEAKRFGLLVEPHLTWEKLQKVERHLYDWDSRGSATNIGIPSSCLRTELERRAEVTGRSKRDLGVDSGGYTSVRVLHSNTLNGLLYSERLEDLRTGDLRWDTVVAVEYVGERE